MTELNPPRHMQNRSDHSAQGDRLLLAGLITRAGVRSTTDLVVTQSAVPAMSVVVSLGHVFVAGTQDTHQGYYHCYNDANVTKTISASSPTLSRIDLVVARVQDTYYTGGVDAWDIFVVQGTPGSPGVRPSLPVNTTEVAEVAVGINATSIVNANITRTAKVVGLRGGVIPVAGTTERDALTAYPGLVVFRDDLDTLEYYDGTAWRSNSGSPVRTIFTASGTWTKPTGARRVKVKVLGGGGGGGGCAAAGTGESGTAGGGGGGAYSENIFDASVLGATVAVTIGAGGAAGSTAGGTGGVGGTSSFGGLITAGGGSGGGGVNPTTGNPMAAGGGGSAVFTGHDLGVAGSPGTYGLSRSGFSYGLAMGGAGAVYGANSPTSTNNGAGSAGARGSGGGGARAALNAGGFAGGVGGSGMIIVETYF